MSGFGGDYIEFVHKKYLKMNELNWIRIHVSVVWWQDCVISLPTENDS